MEETRYDRTEQFQKDWDYERLLENINVQVEDLDDPADGELPADAAPEEPVVFVVGIPRSGSTLLYQLMSESGAFGYTSNLMARFYRNPAFGLRIQRLLQPLLPTDEMTWESEFGLTERWYEPHEFGYFWERHLPFDDHHEPTDRALEKVDWRRFRREIAALQRGFEGPLVFKNLSLDFVVEPIARHIDKARFVRINRKPLAVAASIYRGRVQYYDNEEAWFSTRPRNFTELDHLTPVEQIIEQMNQISGSLDEAKASLDDKKWTEVDYAELCDDPAGVVSAICQAFEVSGPTRELPDSFEVSGVRGPDRVVEALRERLGDGS